VGFSLGIDFQYGQDFIGIDKLKVIGEGRVDRGLRFLFNCYKESNSRSDREFNGGFVEVSNDLEGR